MNRTSAVAGDPARCGEGHARMKAGDRHRVDVLDADAPVRPVRNPPVPTARGNTDGDADRAVRERHRERSDLLRQVRRGQHATAAAEAERARARATPALAADALPKVDCPVTSAAPVRFTKPVSITPPVATAPAAVTIFSAKPVKAGPAPASRDPPAPAAPMPKPAVYGF